MKPTRITGKGCLIATGALAIGLLAPYAALADLNIVGSTHGQNYQGAAVVAAGQAAAAIPLTLCDTGSTATRYQNGVINDMTVPSISIPAGNIVLWVCTVNAVPNFTFRYTGGFSAMAYGNIKAPLGDPLSMFTTIVPGGTGCGTATTQIDPGTGLSYQSISGCTQRTLVSADFATSDTVGTSFATNMCDPTPECASPIADIGIASFPITATPFVVIVGNGVQKCNPTDMSANGKISLTRIQVEAIFTGTIASWNQLGYCVYPVVPISGSTASLVGAGGGDLSPIGTPLGSEDQSIVTCSRPTTAGTRIIFDATIMKDVPQLNFGKHGTNVPPFTGDFNYLANTVADGLTCVQGRQTPSPASAANNNAITYNRADEGASPVNFGPGNVGRMRGGYPVVLDGTLPSNYVAPAVLSTPTAAERAASQKDFRCGRYEFWADWVGIQRTVQNPNQALWDRYVAAIGNLLPLTPAGYFWSVDTKQPGKSIVSEMFVSKSQAKGPQLFNDVTNCS